MKKWRVAPAARRDLDEIWQYTAREGGMAAANRLLDQIEDRLAVLASAPSAGRSRDDIAPDVRSLPAGNYMIYYRSRAGGGIVIARVLHAKRDQKRAF